MKSSSVGAKLFHNKMVFKKSTGNKKEWARCKNEQASVFRSFNHQDSNV